MGFYHALAMLVVSRNNRYRALVRLTCIMLFEVEKPNPNLLTLILILFVYNVSEILRDHFSKHTGLKPGCKMAAARRLLTPTHRLTKPRTSNFHCSRNIRLHFLDLPVVS